MLWVCSFEASAYGCRLVSENPRNCERADLIYKEVCGRGEVYRLGGGEQAPYSSGLGFSNDCSCPWPPGWRSPAPLATTFPEHYASLLLVPVLAVLSAMAMRSRSEKGS
jgi:hypothetical protein